MNYYEKLVALKAFFTVVRDDKNNKADVAEMACIMLNLIEKEMESVKNG